MIKGKSIGGQVENLWTELRPATRRMLETELTAGDSAPSGQVVYDAGVEKDLVTLLMAIDAQIGSSQPERVRELEELSKACASSLLRYAKSADSFALLFRRALSSRDFNQVDKVADLMLNQLAPGEICELARNPLQPIRSIAREALAQLSTSTLVDLLKDPVDESVARHALHMQARDYGSEEARWIITAIEQSESEGDPD
jgi:hypothetical protein